MKCSFRIPKSGFLFLRITICLGFLVTSTYALVGENPYRPIVDRNVFALKPPTPATNSVVQPPSPPAGIELRGISTLLGRPQVLLNIKVPAKPPEQPKDRSLVLDVGQREGEVEILEINPSIGLVRIRNRGSEVALNLKDNATQPQFTAPSPMPAGVVPGIKPALPAPGAVPPPPGAGVPLPTRSLRTDGASGASAPNNPAGVNQSMGTSVNRGPVENAALYSVSQAKNEELIQSGVKVPRLPRHPFLNNNADQ